MINYFYFSLQQQIKWNKSKNVLIFLRRNKPNVDNIVPKKSNYNYIRGRKLVIMIRFLCVQMTLSMVNTFGFVDADGQIYNCRTVIDETLKNIRLCIIKMKQQSMQKYLHLPSVVTLVLIKGLKFLKTCSDENIKTNWNKTCKIWSICYCFEFSEDVICVTLWASSSSYHTVWTDKNLDRRLMLVADISIVIHN